MKQGSQEWHDSRKGRITGSMFAACLGLSPYVSRQKAWRIITGREVVETNPAMQWGTDHEPVAKNQYEIETGNIVEDCGFIPHPKYDFMGCSPDGLVGVCGVIEIKCPQRMYEKVPEYYLPQILGEIHITGRDWCDFIVWTPDEMKVIGVIADKKQWESWERELIEFYEQYVLDDKQPPRRSKKNGV